MRIGLIGAGRVAHHLAHVLNAQHQIVQIYSRSLDKAQHLAAQIGAEAIAEVEQLHSDLDLLIIAVSDQAIAQVIQEIHHDLNLQYQLQHQILEGVPNPVFGEEFLELDWDYSGNFGPLDRQ